MKKSFFLYNESIKSNAINLINDIECREKRPFEITIKPASRKNIQSALMWVLLKKISLKIWWPVKHPDGRIVDELLSDWQWKNVLSASLVGETKLAQCPNGNGMVMIGHSTRNETTEWMSDMIELIYAFAAQQGVDLDAK